jgi:hypothetical protein
VGRRRPTGPTALPVQGAVVDLLDAEDDVGHDLTSSRWRAAPAYGAGRAAGQTLTRPPPRGKVPERTYRENPCIHTLAIAVARSSVFGSWPEATQMRPLS